MKKLLGGCLVVVVLLGIGGAIAAYVVFNKVKSAVTQFAEFGKVPDLERQVRNASRFTAPAGDLLTTSQVERFVGVQKAVRDRIGARFAEFERKYDTLLKKKGDATALDAPAIVAAYGDLAKTWMEAKRAQVDALNHANFSLDEYRWVRGQAYAAIGLPVMDVDIGKLVSEISANSNPTDVAKLAGSVGPSGPEENKHLVEPHRKQLEDNAALAMFGL